MCGDCGCEEANEKAYFDHHHEHVHGDHHHRHRRLLEIEQSVLEKNNHIAHHNQHWFADNKVTCINLMSSPGAGKTTLLEKSFERLKSNKHISVLVGDQQTDHDAKRLQGAGARVKQINTLSSCHLDAQMIEKELGTFVTEKDDLLIVENIGNLVCPAAFDLGEHKKVAILSTTEGEDKPLKYPVLFHKADLILITKMDLTPWLDWNREDAINYIRQVNGNAPILEISAKTGEGMASWMDFLETMTCV